MSTTTHEVETPTEHALRLDGCTPTPLASYLQALGVLRLVADQADPDAKGWWQDDTFILASRLDAPALERFFLERYRPTPLVAPWGARSGFYLGSSEAAARAALKRIASSDLERMAPFIDTIAAVRALLERLGFTEKAGDKDKLRLLRECRAELPDHVLPWLDTCYVLTTDGRGFPPLLGTGGNEGSGSYVSGFAQMVVACVIERAHDDALAAALFATARPATGSSQTPGQFAPLAAGGPNATTGFEGGTILNPWTFLLCLEGTLFFAAAATKRLESAAGSALAYPFTVRAVGAGAGSVALGDEANARAETWFPLWDRPASLAELAAIFAEGRVQVSGRSARDALDFSRAVSSLGMQRGITSFQRYGYLQRFGRNVIAVPIERVTVQRNSRGDLADDLDRGEWLDRFRRQARTREAPARLRTLVSRIEDALFDLTRVRDESRVQDVLERLGEAQVYLARSPAIRDVVPPVPELRANWVHAADDGTPEFRIAAALAGLHAIANAPTPGAAGRDAAEHQTDTVDQPQHARRRIVLPLRVHFAPVGDRRDAWPDVLDRNVTWGSGALTENLRTLAERRLLVAANLNLSDAPWHATAVAASIDVARWLNGELDEIRIRRLLAGLVLARIPSRLRRPPREAAVMLPPAYAVLKPHFTTRDQLVAVLRAGQAFMPAPEDGASPNNDRASRSADVRPPIRDAARIVRLLAADRVEEAVELGSRRLRAQGMPPLMSFKHTTHPSDGRTLLAALLVPIADADLRDVLHRILRPDEVRTPSTSTIEPEV